MRILALSFLLLISSCSYNGSIKAEEVRIVQVPTRGNCTYVSQGMCRDSLIKCYKKMKKQAAKSGADTIYITQRTNSTAWGPHDGGQVAEIVGDYLSCNI